MTKEELEAKILEIISYYISSDIDYENAKYEIESLFDEIKEIKEWKKDT